MSFRVRVRAIDHDVHFLQEELETMFVSEPIIQTCKRDLTFPPWLYERWDYSSTPRYFMNEIRTSIDVPGERTTFDLITTIEYSQQCCTRKGCDKFHRIGTKCCRGKKTCTCVDDSVICYVEIYHLYDVGVINNIRRRKYAKILALCDGKHETEEDIRITEFFKHNEREYQLSKVVTPKLTRVEVLALENERLRGELLALENEVERLKKKVMKSKKKLSKYERRPVRD